MENINDMNRVIAKKGQDSLEIFNEIERNKRRILQRYTHDEQGFSIRISTLINSIQQPHYHTELTEAIMMIEGSIEAYWWNSNSVKQFSLGEIGDIVVFPPMIPHTLDIIMDNTQIVVFKFAYEIGSNDWISPDFIPGEIKEKLLRRE